MTSNKIVLSVILTALTASAYAKEPMVLSQDQKLQTEKVVHDYIIKNPEVVIESLQGYQQKQMDEARKTMAKTQETASLYAKDLFHQANDPIAGNPQGTVTVVEFFDYQCPHCIDMTPVMDKITKANSNVRVVYKEFPIRGPASETAAKVALAANKQGKYLEFQHALMGVNKLPLTDEIVLETAKTVGLNMEKLKTDMNSKEIEQKLKDTNKLARDLKLMGTPAIFVGKTNVAANGNTVVFIPGQVTQDQLQEIINKVK